jgi:hypothetical protein
VLPFFAPDAIRALDKEALSEYDIGERRYRQGRITEVEDTIEIDDEVYGLRASPKKVTGKRGPPTGNSDGRRKRTKIGNTNARRRQ